ncbi:MAG: adenosylmethionine decarboxylase [Pyrinomonadaceae bacterium]
MIVGTEWLIEAVKCDAEKLRDENLLREIFDRVVSDIGLKVIDTVWHKFPGEGGITGMAALTESHLTCHTYPEHRIATFNLYCCRTRSEWEWETSLKSLLDAESVSITKVERGGYGQAKLEPNITNARHRSAGGDE